MINFDYLIKKDLLTKMADMFACKRYFRISRFINEIHYYFKIGWRENIFNFIIKNLLKPSEVLTAINLGKKEGIWKYYWLFDRHPKDLDKESAIKLLVETAGFYKETWKLNKEAPFFIACSCRGLKDHEKDNCNCCKGGTKCPLG